MSKKELTTLLKRYLSDDITPDEKLALAQLISTNTTSEALQNSLEELWNNYQPDQELPPNGSAEQLRLLMEKIDSQENVPQQAAVIRHLPFWKKWKFQAVAAAVVIVVTAVTLYYSTLDRSVKDEDRRELAAVAPKMTRNLVLPDSSMVILQPGSTIDYDPAFGTTSRELTLTGEAWFDVRHDESRPFIVHTGKVSTTVLGTAFTVRAWEGTKDVVVTVNRGRVKVADADRVLGVITPDQQISYNTVTAIASQSNVNATLISSWKEEEYTFDDLTMAETARALQEKYGIAIEILQTGGKDECRFTGSFRQDETIDRVLDVITKVYKASWTRKDNKILIENIHCNN